jgi:rSAM/selenodomain-associated transferase 2
VRLSVIIPALNEDANIALAVERANALAPLEVLIADGGSSDQTLRIARELPCRVINAPRGRARQQNSAAEQATGDVLLFLHADSWLAPEGASQIEQTLQRSPKVPGGVFWHRFDSSRFGFRLIELGDALRVCCTRIGFGDQGIFLRRSVFEQLGGFPDVPLMEDVLLMRRLRDIGRIAFLPGPVHTSARRHEKHGLIRQTLRNWSLQSAERLGVSTSRLAGQYTPHFRSLQK